MQRRTVDTYRMTSFEVRCKGAHALSRLDKTFVS